MTTVDDYTRQHKYYVYTVRCTQYLSYSLKIEIPINKDRAKERH